MPPAREPARDRPRPRRRTENETLWEIGRDSPEALASLRRPPEPDAEEAAAARAKRPRLEILRDAPGWTAVAKPAGVASVRERWAPDAPTALRLLHEARRRADPDAPLPFVIHRIDKETSGVLLFGRTEDGARALSEAFRKRRVAKEYLALVRGAPPEPAGEVEVRLEADRRRPGFMRVVRHGGKPSLTAWRTLETFRGWSLLLVRPRTGRTHQIRVTFAHLGCPVAVDRLYGDGQGILLSSMKRGYKRPRDHGEFPLLGRLGLHAAALEFDDPDAPGTTVRVECPPPKDLRVTLERLRRHALPRG